MSKTGGTGTTGTVEIAHATLKGGTPAKVVNSCTSNRSIIATANAHAVFASSCALKSPTRCSTALTNIVNSYASAWPTVANAHAALVRSCALKSPSRRSAALANL